MNNLTVTSGTGNITYGNIVGTTTGVWNGIPCAIHGGFSCNCQNSLVSTGTNWIRCASCLQFYGSSQAYHVCTTMSPITGTGTGTITGITSTNFGSFTIGSSFKEVKEITTDAILTYEWSGHSFDITLPAKFSDCFLKVGYAWTPLYPLIFSAIENDSKEISFHLIMGITDKGLEGDNVVLKSVTTTKIEDNLTLLQLTERIRQYFKKDEK